MWDCWYANHFARVGTGDGNGLQFVAIVLNV
jgi:hypothetical protein